MNAHVGLATTVAWTPDGKRLVSIGTTEREGAFTAPGEIKLWDAATLTPLPLWLEGATGKVSMTAALSPDGQLLAAGCFDMRIRLWNIGTGALVATLERHTGDQIWQLVFSPDGKHLASRAMDSNTIRFNYNSAKIKIWDLDTRKAIVSIDKLYRFGSLAFSSDGKRVAFNAAESVLTVRDAFSSRELFVKDMKYPVTSMAFSPDDRRLVVAGRTSDVQILDAGTGELVKICPGDGGYRDKLKFSPDGQRLAAAGYYSGLELWDAKTGQRIRTFKGHDGFVMDLAFSPDGTRIASAGLDGRAKSVGREQRPRCHPDTRDGATTRLYRAFPRWTYRPAWQI